MRDLRGQRSHAVQYRRAKGASQKMPLIPVSLTPCFSRVLSEAFGISTALAVFRCGQTAKAVLERATATNTQLKQGVNEMPNMLILF